MIRRVSAWLGGAAFIGSSELLAAMEVPATNTGSFTPADIAFLDEIAETILPETKTPGAKAAQVGTFMAVMVTDCYRPPQQALFRDGMARIEAAMQRRAQVSFMQASPAQRLSLLNEFDQQQKKPSTPARRSSKRAMAPQDHFFRMMKELTLFGYFTSEIGCTQAQRYVETPGHFAPNVPYVPGTPSWADHA